jgi:glucose/mannose-6-phosphate isomerase
MVKFKKLNWELKQMLSTIKNYPEMISEAVENAKKISLPKADFDNIVFCGMGGSLIVGYFIKDVLKYSFKKPIEVFGDYRLPGSVNEKTLVIFISYSGNTEEMLSQFSEALGRKCKIIGIACGGKLEEWCTRLGIPFIKVPAGYKPRYAAPAMLISLMTYLDKAGAGNFRKDMEECGKVLGKISNDSLDNLAKRINGRDIVVYAPNDFSSMVRRFKNDFNENSKIFIACNTFPEMDHNDIDAFENKELNKNRAVIIVRDQNESEEMKNRIEITKEIIRKNVASIDEIWTAGESRLAKIFSLIYASGYISCRLAELNGIDSAETQFLDTLKTQLKKRTNLVERLEKRIFSK